MAGNDSEETTLKNHVTDLVRRFEIQNNSGDSERAVSDSSKRFKRRNTSKVGAIRKKELDALIKEKEEYFSYVRLQLEEDLRILDLHHAGEIAESTKRYEAELKKKEHLLHSTHEENERLESLVKEQADFVTSLKIENRELKELLKQRERMLRTALETCEERNSVLNDCRQQIKEILDEIAECQKRHLRKEAKLTFYRQKFNVHFAALDSVYRMLFERVLEEQKYYSSELELLMSELVTNENEANEEAEEIHQLEDEIESLTKQNASLETSIDKEGNISNLLDQLDEYEDVIEGLQVAKKQMEEKLKS